VKVRQKSRQYPVSFWRVSLWKAKKHDEGIEHFSSFCILTGTKKLKMGKQKGIIKVNGKLDNKAYLQGRKSLSYVRDAVKEGVKKGEVSNSHSFF
jgi:hypothetical protein